MGFEQSKFASFHDEPVTETNRTLPENMPTLPEVQQITDVETGMMEKVEGTMKLEKLKLSDQKIEVSMNSQKNSLEKNEARKLSVKGKTEDPIPSQKNILEKNEEAPIHSQKNILEKNEGQKKPNQSKKLNAAIKKLAGVSSLNEKPEFNFKWLKKKLNKEAATEYRCTEGANVVVCSPGGTLLASSNFSDRAITIWAWDTKESKYLEKEKLEKHSKSVICLVWSCGFEQPLNEEKLKDKENEKSIYYLASGSLDNKVIIWEARGNDKLNIIATLDHDAKLISLQFNKDSMILVSLSSPGTVIRLWNMKEVLQDSLKNKHPIEPSDQKSLEKFPATCLCWHEDFLFVGCELGYIYRYKIPEKNKKFDSTTFDPWNEQNPNPNSKPNQKLPPKPNSNITCLSKYSDGLIAANERGNVFLWTFKDKIECKKIFEISHFISSIDWCPQNELIALGSSKDDSVVILRKKKEHDEFKKYKYFEPEDNDLIVNNICWKPNSPNESSALLIACNDNTIRCWNLKDKNKIHCDWANFTVMDYAPKTQKMVAGLENGDVVLIDLKIKDMKEVLKKAIATGDKKKEKEADDYIKTNGKFEMVKMKTRHEKSVTCLAFSPDENEVVTGSMDKTIRIWDLKDKKEIKNNNVGKEITRVAWCSANTENKLIAYGSVDNTFYLWNTENETGLLFTKSMNASYISMAFSQDGQKLYLSTSEKNILIYSVSKLNLNNQNLLSSPNWEDQLAIERNA